MPELPEVETIRRGLEPKLKGLTITGVQVLEPKSAQFSAKEFRNHILDKEITSLKRFGKVLIVHFDGAYSLMAHLKMTGQLVLEVPAGTKYKVESTKNRNRNKEQKPNSKFQIPNSANVVRYGGGHPTKSFTSKLPDSSTRIIFQLSDGSILYFNDQRKFGWIKLIKRTEFKKDKFLSKLGPEPTSKKFSPAYFKKKLEVRNTPIKAAILDQTVLAGVGNIYADEALHFARIHPETTASKLNAYYVKRLREGIIKVMKDSLDMGGTSFSHYVNHNGLFGDYLAHARVFRREGLPCRVCGTVIQKTRVAGRGTHFCPRCQKVQ